MLQDVKCQPATCVVCLCMWL